MTHIVRGRLATAVVSLCLMMELTGGSASAVLPVTGAGGGGGTCVNCGTTARPNTQTTTGNATGGYVNSNGNGTSNTAMSYTTPTDGTQYSGTVTITVNDANGNNLYSYSGSISDTGNGSTQFTGLDGIYIPVGANILISLTESNWVDSFKASWHMQNYQP